MLSVSCPSCGAPLVLTETLAMWSDQPRADSLQLWTKRPRGGGLGSSTIFKKFDETYAPS